MKTALWTERVFKDDLCQEGKEMEANGRNSNVMTSSCFSAAGNDFGQGAGSPVPRAVPQPLSAGNSQGSFQVK